MSKKEKLQAELHAIEVSEWWEARPHILEFECDYNNGYDDNGFYYKSFRAYNIILNHEWIKYNGIKWQTFCDYLGIPLYPADADEIADCWEEYLRDINNPDNYDIDYPDFIQHTEETMRNPNFFSTVGGV